MRIWHQSFTDLSAFPLYRDTLAAHAARVMQGRVQVSVHGLRPGTYPPGVAPMQVNSVAAMRTIGEQQVLEAALAAERSGHDAMAIGCFFDPALHAARSLVDIPVLSLTESCMLTACSLGRRFAMISVTPFQKMLTEDLAAACGLQSRLAGVVAMTPAVNLFDLERPEAADALKASFASACDAAIALGAEVIIPGDGVLNEFLVRHGVLHASGAVVLDALGVLFHHAEFIARGRAAGVLDVSRALLYRQPGADMLAHARAAHGRFDCTETDFSGPNRGPADQA
ncbi:MAG: aspartate/glutamate racemase family protein [Gammaproteobacteria bacterium]|nr:aspartate/glutamate racemase family protein [Gammaproteobacteria bacterium]MBU1440199.1 aspartate/glutamate racemase family protein [Gammaproteobacteria bacterium]MBU2285234.1 aspartate/glutamate racemase family protein [Gammaproteobacteria bacterium]